MFSDSNLSDLGKKLLQYQTQHFKKLITKSIENNRWMQKLIEFYEEEVAGDSDSSSSGSSSDSDSSSSESESSASVG